METIIIVLAWFGLKSKHIWFPLIIKLFLIEQYGSVFSYMKH